MEIVVLAIIVPRVFGVSPSTPLYNVGSAWFQAHGPPMLSVNIVEGGGGEGVVIVLRFLFPFTVTSLRFHFDF